VFAEFFFLALAQGLQVMDLVETVKFQRQVLWLSVVVGLVPLVYRFSSAIVVIEQSASRLYRRLRRREMVPKSPPKAIEEKGILHGVGLCLGSAVILVVLLGSYYLPAIESGFGGAKIRHAQFDLVPEDFGNATRALLGLTNVTSLSDVVSTPALEVYFSNAEFAVVKPVRGARGTIHIPMPSVKAVHWLD
jgi:hypothetical protein